MKYLIILYQAHNFKLNNNSLPRLWPGTRGIKKPAPKAQGAQKKGKRREKRDYFNYIPIYLYLKVYQTVDKNEAVQFISFSLIREK